MLCKCWSFMIPCMQNLKRHDTNELIYKTERLRLVGLGGRRRGRNRSGIGDGCVHNAIFKMDNQQGPAV